MKLYVPLALVVALLFGAVIGRSLPAPHDPVRTLAGAAPGRAFAPRLSIRTEYRRCTPVAARPGDTVSREECETGEESSLDPGVFTAGGESHDPDSLQASALARVIWPEETEPSLDMAIAQLGKALRLSPGSVPLLVDLSAAHLLRAERQQNPRDLMAALDYALEAREHEPGNMPALFNAALTLQALGADEQAARAWNAYLAIDSKSRWADEARQRKRGLITETLREPAEDASTAEVEAFAERYPQETRQRGWKYVLGAWGEAVERGNAARAASLLYHAEALGNALERRGGDASLADVVRAIRAAHADAAVTATLAKAHRAYTNGQSHYQIKHQAAFEEFSRVIDARPPSPALLQWARAFQAGTLEYLEKRPEAKTALRALLDEVDGARYPALEARARWMLGTLLLRDGEVPQASAQYHTATSLFSRCGETENVGALVAMDAEAAYERGDTLLAYASLHRALRALRPYRGSVWLHGQLLILGRLAVLDEMPRAAAAIHDEDVSVATRSGKPRHVVEALLHRALVRAINGDTAGASRDRARATPLVDSIPLEGGIEWTRAVIQSGRTGPTAAAAMDSAVDYFAKTNVLWLFPAIIRRADARLAAGDVDGATADLDTVTARIRGLSQKEGNVQMRGAMIEQARSRFDELVMLHLRAGRTKEALEALERGRISFAPQREDDGVRDVGPLVAPRGEVAVEFALIHDTLLTWTIRGDTIQLLRRPMDRNTFLLAVEQASAALESTARAEAASPALRRLYDWLIRPVRGHLGLPETPLVILADGEVARVPFAALMDARQKDRYLMEDHPLRFAATLRDAARPASDVRQRAGRALLVADPDFDQLRYPALDPLGGARAEVASLGPLYPGSVRLEGSSATRAAFTEHAQAAGIIHYAGHALFDDARPERSYLVLAGADTTGRLTAEAVLQMRLDGVRLVVLSACRTLPSREGRSGGFAGLSGALLTAGAGGVVGSLWQVNDSLTQPLMLAFHREYLDSGNPAAALRQAQLQMLRSDDPELRSPATWAGFRYTGN